MTPWRRLRGWWRTLRRGQALDADLHSELTAYLALIEAEAVSRGADPAAARRQALVEMGAVSSVEEQVRAGRPGAWLRDFLRDGVFGWRLLRRSPSFSAAAVVTLALAIGSTAAMGTIVRTVVLAPLPYAQPEALVRLEGIGYYGELLELTRRSRTMVPATYGATAPMTLVGYGDPIRLPAAVASASLFEVLKVSVERGVPMRAEDNAPDAAPTVWVTHRAWRDTLGADPDVVGRSLRLDGQARILKGVLPDEFVFPDASVALWIPATYSPAHPVALWSRGANLLARLQPGASLDAADRELRTLAPGFAAMFPWRMPEGYGTAARVRSLQEAFVGDTARTLSVAFVAIAFVGLIACVNVGILLLGRADARTRELTTRAALGATRGRLARQVAAECVVLTGAGGLGALIVAAASLLGAPSLLPADVPRVHEIHPDGWMVAAVLAASLAAGIGTGVVPLWRAFRMMGRPVADARTLGGDRAGRLLVRTLVAVEVAMAALLVVGAGLLVRSLDRLLAVTPGFSPDGVLTATIAPSPLDYRDGQARRDLAQTLTARIGAMPGVVGVASADRVPFGGDAYSSVFAIEGQPDPAVSGRWPLADVRAVVSERFFDVMRVPILRGRSFTSADGTTAEPVVIINATLAAAHWPGQDVIGKRIRFPGPPSNPWLKVVGVVGDVRWERLDDEPQAALYLPEAQASFDVVRLVIRAGAQGAVTANLRATIQAVNPALPLDEVRWLDDRVAESAGASRFLAQVFIGFAIAGALLGAIGLYGVTSDAVAREGREFALRLAVGASPGGILRLVIVRHATVALMGLCGGLLAAWLASGLLTSSLFDIPPTDATTYLSALALLVLVIVAACAVPAWRASRLPLVSVLRDS